MAAGATCAKVILMIFNVITALAGIALLGIGIWVLADDSIIELLDFIEVAHDDPLLKYGAYLLIAVGALALVFGIFGVVAAYTQNRCMLGFYAFLLLIIMAGEIAGGVLLIIYKDKITDKLEEEALKKLGEDELIVEEDGEYKYTAFGGAFSYVQYEFECCGITEQSYKDYNSWVEKIAGVKYELLPTCCVGGGKEVRKSPHVDEISEYVEKWDHCNSLDNLAEKHQTGCKEELLDWFEEKAYILIGCGIGIGCLQILGFILAICLCQYPRSKDYE